MPTERDIPGGRSRSRRNVKRYILAWGGGGAIEELDYYEMIVSEATE